MKTYQGFSNHEQLHALMEEKGFAKHQYMIINFNGQHYAAAFENHEKEFICGLKDTWYKQDNYLYYISTEKFEKPYDINVRAENVRPYLGNKLYKELLCISPDISITYQKSEKDTPVLVPEQTDMYKHYMNLLGKTAMDKYHIRAQILNMQGYFPRSQAITEFDKMFILNPSIVALNPFRALAKLESGNIAYFQIKVRPQGIIICTPLKRKEYK